MYISLVIDQRLIKILAANTRIGHVFFNPQMLKTGITESGIRSFNCTSYKSQMSVISEYPTLTHSFLKYSYRISSLTLAFRLRHLKVPPSNQFISQKFHEMHFKS